MPFVTVQTIKGILDDAQKRSLHARITDLMVEIEGQGRLDFRSSVFVKIEEQEPAMWSFGGISPTEDDVARMFGHLGADGKRVTKP